MDKFFLVTEEFDDMTGEKRFYGPEFQLIGPVGLFGGSKTPSAATKPVSSSDLVIIQPAAVIEDSGIPSYWWAFKAVSDERQVFGDVAELLTLVDGKRSRWESLEPIESVLNNGDLLEIVMFPLDKQLFKDGSSSTELKIRVLNQDFEIVQNFKEAMGQVLGAVGQNQGHDSINTSSAQSASIATDENANRPSGDLRADGSSRGPREIDF